MKKLLPLFALFLAFNTSAQTYTVLTYNIRLDNPDDGPDRWDLRKEALAQTVLSYSPALAGFQEVLSQQIQFLDTQLHGYQRFGVGREDGKEKGEFSPIYVDTSVFKILEGRTIWMSPTPDMPGKGWDAACERIATLLTLQDLKSGDTILAVNTHWDHVGKIARLNSAMLVKTLYYWPIKEGARVIFMGDLNSTPDEPPAELLRQVFTEACPPAQSKEGTFNGFELNRTEFKRIDYVWLSPENWEVKQYLVPHPMVNGRHVSDHFPVVVSIKKR